MYFFVIENIILFTDQFQLDLEPLTRLPRAHRSLRYIIQSAVVAYTIVLSTQILT
jgi:hypothetical protein